MPETLEAEVVEIDGKPPPPPDKPTAGRGRVRGMQEWTVKLDRRWWPLWVLLGGLSLVVGVVFGVLYLAFALLRALIRLFVGAFRRF